MSRQRATFGKLQRERDKQAKATAKRERRRAASEQTNEAEPDAGHEGRGAGESAPVLIDLIADLHRRFENSEISLESYEEQKAELLSRLPID